MAGGRPQAQPDVRPQGRRAELPRVAAAPAPARPGRGPRRREARRVRRDVLAAARRSEPEPCHPRSLPARLVPPHPASPRRVRCTRADPQAPDALPRGAGKGRRRHRDRRQGDDDRAVDPVLRRQRGARRVQRRRRRDQAALRARSRAAHLPAAGRRSDPREDSKTSETAPSSPSSPTPAPDPRRSSAASRGTTSATRRSATSTPSATAPGTRRC